MKTWYTYLLIDSRNWSVFYVGKGTGKRISSHVAEVKRGEIGDNPRKYQRIREILESGWKVIEVVFSRHSDEDEAFCCEDLLIETLSDQLTNIAGSRAMERRERCELMLKRLKPLSEWLRTASKYTLDWAAKYSGSPEAFYRRFVAEVVKESNRTGGNWVHAHR
jgi:hypothetical protein